jgi:hypothetical protein
MSAAGRATTGGETTPMNIRLSRKRSRIFRARKIFATHCRRDAEWKFSSKHERAIAESIRAGTGDSAG